MLVQLESLARVRRVSIEGTGPYVNEILRRDFIKSLRPNEVSMPVVGPAVGGIVVGVLSPLDLLEEVPDRRPDLDDPASPPGRA